MQRSEIRYGISFSDFLVQKYSLTDFLLPVRGSLPHDALLTARELDIVRVLADEQKTIVAIDGLHLVLSWQLQICQPHRMSWCVAGRQGYVTFTHLRLQIPKLTQDLLALAGQLGPCSPTLGTRPPIWHATFTVTSSTYTVQHIFEPPQRVRAAASLVEESGVTGSAHETTFTYTTRHPYARTPVLTRIRAPIHTLPSAITKPPWQTLQVRSLRTPRPSFLFAVRRM